MTTHAHLPTVFLRCRPTGGRVLTDRRLIVLKPSWPWGFRFEADYPREACRITKVKPRVDGSTLVVIGHAGEDLCFYVPRRSRDGGIAIMEALR